MKSINSLPRSCLLFPAVTDGRVYRAANSIHVASHESLALAVARPALRESHEYRREPVFWNDEFFLATVLVSRLASEGDYIVTDDNGQLYEANRLETPSAETLTVDEPEHIDTTEGVWPEHRVSVSTDFVEPEFDYMNPLTPHSAPRASWSDVVVQSRCVILGPPGAGKTSTLRRLHAELSERAHADASKPKPLYVSLRSWSADSELSGWLTGQVHSKVEVSRSIANRVFNGGVIILLDGLDEVVDTHRSRLRENISAMADRSPQLRIFVTCRDGAYDWKLYQFNHYAIRPFTWNDQKNWVAKRLGTGLPAVQFLAALRNNSEVQTLAENPMALSTVAALFSRGWCTPLNTSQVLNSVVDGIVNQWDPIRGIHRTHHPLARPENKTALFAELGAKSLTNVLRSFLPQFFAPLLRKLVAVFKPTEQADATSALELLREHTGFIRCNSDNAWTFTNTSIADYFAARAFVDSIGGNDDTMQGRLDNARWQRTWLVACGVTHDATALLRAMLDADGVNPGIKSNLLARGLAQARMVEPELYDRCLHAIVQFLETGMLNVETRVESPREHESAACSLVTTAPAQAAPEAASHVSALRTTLFYCKAQDSMRALILKLDESNCSSVVNWSRLLRHDGSYNERWHGTTLRCIVSSQLKLEDQHTMERRVE